MRRRFIGAPVGGEIDVENVTALNGLPDSSYAPYIQFNLVNDFKAKDATDATVGIAAQTSTAKPQAFAPLYICNYVNHSSGDVSTGADGVDVETYVAFSGTGTFTGDAIAVGGFPFSNTSGTGTTARILAFLAQPNVSNGNTTTAIGLEAQLSNVTGTGVLTNNIGISIKPPGAGAAANSWAIKSDTSAQSQFLGAINHVTANSAEWIRSSASELLTLSTSGLTTDTSANLLPANAIIEAVVCRVTTTITTTTNWAVGDPTTSARFSSANATLVAGTTSVGLNHQKGSVSTEATGPTQTAAAKVRITCTGANPGAGAIRITVFYSQFVAPTS